MSKQFYFKQFSFALVRSLNIKSVRFQVTQFSISTLFRSIWATDRTLSGATTPGQSGPGCDGNEGELRIPQSSSSTWTSPSDCLWSYLGHSLQKYKIHRHRKNWKRYKHKILNWKRRKQINKKAETCRLDFMWNSDNQPWIKDSTITNVYSNK